MARRIVSTFSMRRYSIYYPVVKYPALIQSTIESLLDASDEPLHKFYLVADAADDDVLRFLKTYTEAHPGYFDLFIHHQKQGPAKCLNRIIECLSPQEDLFVVTNALYPKNMISRLQHMAYQHEFSEHIGVVSCSPIKDISGIYHDEIERLLLTHPSIEQLHQFLNQFFAQYPLDWPQIEKNCLRFSVGEFVASAYFTHRCFERVGFFDESLFFMGTEWDYATRMTMAELVTVFSNIVYWPLAKGLAFSHQSHYKEYLQEGKRRWEQKYRGIESEIWKEICGCKCRQLIPKQTQDFVLVGDQKLSMVHSVR